MVAGYPADYIVPFALAVWQWHGDHWASILVSNYTFVVESDGTGTISFTMSNQAGRDDLRTDMYIDGVKVIDFAQLTC